MRQLRAKYSEMHWLHKADVEAACWAICLGVIGCGIGFWGGIFLSYYAGSICTFIGVVGLWKTGILDNPSPVLP